MWFKHHTMRSRHWNCVAPTPASLAVQLSAEYGNSTMSFTKSREQTVKRMIKYEQAK